MHAGFVNGSLAHIVEMSPPHAPTEIAVRLLDEPDHASLLRVRRVESTATIAGTEYIRSMFPMIPAYAMTIPTERPRRVACLLVDRAHGHLLLEARGGIRAQVSGWLRRRQKAQPVCRRQIQPDCKRASPVPQRSPRGAAERDFDGRALGRDHVHRAAAGPPCAVQTALRPRLAHQKCAPVPALLPFGSYLASHPTATQQPRCPHPCADEEPLTELDPDNLPFHPFVCKCSDVRVIDWETLKSDIDEVTHTIPTRRLKHHLHPANYMYSTRPQWPAFEWPDDVEELLKPDEKTGEAGIIILDLLHFDFQLKFNEGIELSFPLPHGLKVHTDSHTRAKTLRARVITSPTTSPTTQPPHVTTTVTTAGARLFPTARDRLRRLREERRLHQHHSACASRLVQQPQEADEGSRASACGEPRNTQLWSHFL